MANVLAKDYLKTLLLGSFGQITFSTRKLGCEDLFDSLDGRILYFYRRLQTFNGQAINEETCTRLLAFTDRALSGELKTIDSMVLSSRLANTLAQLTGLDFTEFELCYSDEMSTRTAKKGCLLEIIESTMQLFIGCEKAPKELVLTVAKSSYQRARKTLLNRKHNGLPYGVEAFYFNVIEVNYPDRLQRANENLDIVHFQGLSWTNQNREFLLKSLMRENLSIRVALLSPDSPFFASYADFIDVSARYLREKTEEVVKIWDTLVTTARTMTGTAAEFKLVYSKGFPAKALYRFDNAIIVTPTTNARPKAQFMSYECVDDKQGEKDAYSVYLSEIEWLMETGEVIIERPKQEGIFFEQASRRDALAGLHWPINPRQ